MPVRSVLNPSGALLGTQNAILTGTSHRYYVPDFEGCLSIKTVVSGSAVWEASKRRFVVHENCYLLLNDRQTYSITIDAVRKVTTFCIFFERGFVEDAWRTAIAPATELLEAPEPWRRPALEFIEKIEPRSPRLSSLLERLQARVARGEDSLAILEDDFISLAQEVLREHRDSERIAARLPALRASTRQELYCRVLRGRDYLLSSLDRDVALSTMARAACLSPFHFHRAFTSAFRRTPHQYLTDCRLERAAGLLRGKDRSITEVSLESGFDSPASFSSLFRSRFGQSPRDFRRTGAD